MALSKFLDARNDYAFKRIFGREKNKDILIHFLNDILGFTGLAAIQDVEFLATILDPEIAAKKQSIVDVLCKDSQGSNCFRSKFDEGVRVGHEKGRLECIQIGHEKGRAEGKQEGREEGKKQAKIAVVRNLLKASLSVDLIA
ncbi:transposase [Trichonephila inaurata madagascariensis]|uniref:Transposase n=1 Tax=Trichonephila inaurata madagascariensis TaxID=2747483 RepID=A0A8X6WS26_9ARAC|nr:transposase [Trichonephila inaurata madagascariensis]